MRLFILAIILSHATFLLGCNTGIQLIEKQNYENYSSVKIPDSQQRTFHSEIYNQEITLQIYLPMDYYEPDTTFSKYSFLQCERIKSYPVLYLLDSDVYFGMASGIARLLQWEKKSPGIIIVGVSYGLSKWWDKRFRDYSPFSDSSLSSHAEAAKFLEMHEKELIPYIESNFRADAKNRILFGHSSGAIFTLYSLFSKPELFQGYISASPWMQYLSKFFYGVEEKYFNKRNDLPAKLYLSMGSLEQNKIPEWERFANLLSDRKYRYLKMKKVIAEDEVHLTVAPVSLLKGLQWYFSKE